MKYLIIIFIMVLPLLGEAQTNTETLLTKNNVKSIEIKGYEYSKKKLIKQTYFIEELDKYGNTVTFKKIKNEAVLSRRSYTFSKDGTTSYEKQLDKSGKLKYSFVTIKNEKDKTLRRMQISAVGDTLVNQTWLKDKNDNDSILFNTLNSKKIISYKWHYNDGGVLVSKERFDSSGDLLKSENYTYSKKGNCLLTKNDNRKIIRNKCKEGNKETLNFLDSRIGYLYGLKLVSEKKGKRVETLLENGLIDTIQYFSKKGELLASIEYTYNQ